MIFKNKRSEIEIISKILSVSKNGARKTCLMYQSNICYNLFMSYFNFLLGKKFIEVKMDNPIGKNYYITENGEKFLSDINNVLEKVK